MPPTSNSLYVPVGGRLIKSAEGRRYEMLCNLWRIRNFRVVDDVTKLLSAKPKGHPIKLDAQFIFMHARLIGKKGQIKRLDCTNRIKSSHDALMNCLKIDDCLITEGSFEKITCERSKDEGVIFTLSFSKLRSLDQSLGPKPEIA